MLSEHQYKLGATFALVGENELAYLWLKKLYKHGFDGDGPFIIGSRTLLFIQVLKTLQEAFGKKYWS